VPATRATPHPPSAPSPLCGGEKALGVCSSQVGVDPRGECSIEEKALGVCSSQVGVDPRGECSIESLLPPASWGEKVAEGRMRGVRQPPMCVRFDPANIGSFLEAGAAGGAGWPSLGHAPRAKLPALEHWMTSMSLEASTATSSEICAACEETRVRAHSAGGARQPNATLACHPERAVGWGAKDPLPKHDTRSVGRGSFAPTRHPLRMTGGCARRAKNFIVSSTEG